MPSEGFSPRATSGIAKTETQRAQAVKPIARFHVPVIDAPDGNGRIVGISEIPPIRRPAVMLAQCDFLLAGDGFLRIHIRTISHLLFGQTQMEGLISPIQLVHRLQRYDNISPLQPASDVDDQITDRPRSVVKKKITNLS